jgi:hypothetical protein
MITPQPQSLVKSELWNRYIPRTNNIFLGIDLALVFILDLAIIINSPELKPFWYAMLFVLVIQLVFWSIENYYLSPKLKTQPTTASTQFFYIFSLLKNILFLLNYIPLVQIIGWIGGVFAGPVIVVGYIVTLWFQFKRKRV